MLKSNKLNSRRFWLKYWLKVFFHAYIYFQFSISEETFEKLELIFPLYFHIFKIDLKSKLNKIVSTMKKIVSTLKEFVKDIKEFVKDIKEFVKEIKEFVKDIKEIFPYFKEFVKDIIEIFSCLKEFLKEHAIILYLLFVILFFTCLYIISIVCSVCYIFICAWDYIVVFLYKSYISIYPHELDLGFFGTAWLCFWPIQAFLCTKVRECFKDDFYYPERDKLLKLRELNNKSYHISFEDILILLILAFYIFFFFFLLYLLFNSFYFLFFLYIVIFLVLCLDFSFMSEYFRFYTFKP